MAKINQYPAKTVPSNNDEFILHDPSSGSTKKMTRGDLIGGAPLPANSVDTQAIADGSVGKTELDFDSGIWWEEIGRFTQSSSGTSMSVSFPARKYLRVFVNTIATGGAPSVGLRVNGDTGNNYALRASTNGGADATAASQSSIGLETSAAEVPFFVVMDLYNVANAEKFIISSTIGAGAGAGSAPGSRIVHGKWANTAEQITSIQIVRISGSGNYAAGSSIVVLGHN